MMNLKDQAEVAKFRAWVQETKGVKTSQRFQDLVTESITKGIHLIANPMDLVWRAYSDVHVDSARAAIEQSAAPLHSTIHESE